MSSASLIDQTGAADAAPGGARALLAESARVLERAGVPTPQADAELIAGFVLGIVSLLAWLIPLVGAPVAVVGLVLSAVGRSKVARTGARNGTQAAVGIVLSVVGLVLSIGNAALGAYLAMS